MTRENTAAKITPTMTMKPGFLLIAGALIAGLAAFSTAQATFSVERAPAGYESQ
ncbi:MAG: hypothetical protein AAF619_05755 [Pseudomonadota bacterium]